MGIAPPVEGTVLCGALCKVCGKETCTRAPHDFSSGHVHPVAEDQGLRHSWRAITEDEELKDRLKVAEAALKKYQEPPVDPEVDNSLDPADATSAPAQLPELDSTLKTEDDALTRAQKILDGLNKKS